MDTTIIALKAQVEKAYADRLDASLRLTNSITGTHDQFEAASVNYKQACATLIDLKLQLDEAEHEARVAAARGK